MKLDKAFCRELAKANGDGGREDMFKLLKTIREAARYLSCPQAANLFGTAIKTYGRVAVGICVAASIVDREDRLEYKTACWAREVLKLWTNRPVTGTSNAIINDGLHPSRIEEYAGAFMRLTTEE